MTAILQCRKSIVSIIAICCLTFLGWNSHSTDVATSISLVAVGLAGSGAYEDATKHKNSLLAQKSPQVKDTQADDNT